MEKYKSLLSDGVTTLSQIVSVCVKGDCAILAIMCFLCFIFEGYPGIMWCTLFILISNPFPGHPEPVFTNHSQEHSLSFSPKFCKFECNTTSDWLNHMV